MSQSGRKSSAVSGSDGNSQQLAQLKIAARHELLAMSPTAAQQRVNEILFPQYWELQAQDCSWEESIPTSYGEVDA